MPFVSEIVDFLDANGSLLLGQSPCGNKDLSDLDVYNVDWKNLFPNEEGRRDVWELPPYSDIEGLKELNDILNIIRINSEPKKSIEYDIYDQTWDVCAWYQPMYFYAYNWGIFITEGCLISLAEKITQFLKFPNYSSMPSVEQTNLIKSIIRASFLLLYLHEYYHHKTESFGIRLHVVEGLSRYIPNYYKVYKPNAGTDNQLEESIANAYMYRTLPKYEKWFPLSVLEAALEYLEKSFPHNSPSYRKAPIFLEDDRFSEGQDLLMSQIQESTLKPSKNTEWNIASRINQPFYNMKSEIWFIVPKGKKPLIPTFPLSTCSSMEMIEICHHKDYKIDKGGGKGSHIKLKKLGHPTVIFPGNESNLSPPIARNVLDALGHKISDLTKLLKSSNQRDQLRLFDD